MKLSSLFIFYLKRGGLICKQKDAPNGLYRLIKYVCVSCNWRRQLLLTVWPMRH